MILLVISSVTPGSVQAVTFFWDQATSGNWNDTTKWNPNTAFPADFGDEGIIDATGASYTVTLGVNVELDLLRVNSTDANVNHSANTLDWGSTGNLEVLQGSYTLNGGTISGGSISTTDGTFIFGNSSSNRLTNNAVFNGDILLDQNGSRVRFESGADFTGNATISGSGTTFLSYAYDTTLSNRTINLDGSNTFFSLDGNTTVTLDTTTLIRGEGTLSSDHFVTGTQVLNNRGIIRSDLSGSDLTIQVDNFTNESGGLVEAINGAEIRFGTLGHTSVNEGTVQASNGSSLVFNGDWSSTATSSITIDNTSSIELNGNFSTPSVQAIDNAANGTVTITGDWDNSGESFTFDATTNIFILDGGTISGGVLNASSASQRLVFVNDSSNIFTNGAIYNGDIILDENNARVRFQNGADFNGDATLSGAGTTFLSYEYDATLTDRTINLETANAFISINNNANVTLETDVLIRGEGDIDSDNFVSGTQVLTNKGTITNDTSSILNIAVDTFANDTTGLIEANNGGTINLGSGINITTNAGTIQASNGSTITFNGVWSSTGNIIVDATSTIELNNNYTTSSVETIDNSAGGTVSIDGVWDNSGDTFTFDSSTNSFLLDTGTISGGTLTPGNSNQRLLFSSNSSNFLSNNLIYDGDLLLDTASARVRFQSGADFTGDATLSGTGSIFLVYEYDAILNNRTINLDTANSNFNVEGDSTVTLGSSTTLRGQGTFNSDSFLSGTQQLINQGNIINDTTGTLNINVDTFTNDSTGTVESNAGGTLNFGSSGHVSNNAGLIQALNNSLVRLRGNWSSTGNIVLDATSTLELENDFNTSSVSTIDNSANGTVLIQGNWDNTSSSFTFDSSTNTFTLDGGTISGGTLTPGTSDQRLLFANNSSNKLAENLVYDGDLVIDVSNGRVRFQSGADFTGDATLNNTTGSSRISYEYDATLDNRTINLDASNSSFTVEGDSSVTLGTNTLLRGQGSINSDTVVSGAQQLINTGTITNDLANTLDINVDTFINDSTGIIQATAGGILNFGNSGHISNNAGLIHSLNGSTIRLRGDWSSTGNIIVDATSTLELENSFTTDDVRTIDNSAGGTVLIQGSWDNLDENFNFSSTTGSLTLDNGSISEGTLTPTASEGLIFTSSSNNILSNNLIYDGDIILDGSSSRVRIQSGADFTGDAMLDGTGTPILSFENDGTFDNRTIHMINTTSRLSVESNSNVTFGTMTNVVGNGTIQSDIFVSGSSQLNNAGTITNDTTQSLSIQVDTFVNENTGVVEVTGGGDLNFGTTGDVSVNNGIVRALNSSLVRLRGTWSSTGTILTDATSTIELENDYTTTDLRTLDNSANGTVFLQGAWDNSGENFVFDSTKKTITFDGGTISGGTITAGTNSDERLAFTSGNNRFTDNVSYVGDIILDGSSSRAYFQSGSDFSGNATLSGSGTSILSYQYDATLDNKIINIDVSSGIFSVDDNSTVTLASGAVIRGIGQISSDNVVTGTQELRNQGTITNDTTGTLSINVDTFTNEAGGIVQANNGGTVNFGSSGHTSNNAGTLEATNSSLLRLRGDWSSTGTISLDATSTVELENDYTTSDISTISNSAGGTVLLQGTWNAGNSNLNFDNNVQSIRLDGGTITGDLAGGTLTAGTGNERLFFAGNNNNIISNNVTYDGDIFLDLSSGRVRFQSGSDFTGDAHFTAGGAPLINYEYDVTLDNRTFNMDSASSQLKIDGDSTVTLGTNMLIRGRGTIDSDFFTSGDSTLVNQGTIRADISGSTLSITTDTFDTDSGNIEATNGGVLSISGGYSQTTGKTRLENGTITARTASVNDTILTHTLEGTGTLTADVDVMGMFAPGLSAGSLQVNGDFTLNSTTTSIFEIGGLGQGTEYDFVDITGDLMLNGILQVDIIDGFETGLMIGDTFTLFESTNLGGSFLNVNSGDILDLSNGIRFNVQYGASSSFDPDFLVLETVSVVPEPSTYLLMALGLLLIWPFIRRKA